MQKTFFVITPYGNEHGDPAEKEVFALVQGVRQNILNKAVERCRAQEFDVVAEFGSDTAHGENIWERIGTQISEAHGVIGVLASDKPNSFIEIGLAYGMWYTPILLRYDKYDVPSDIAGDQIPVFTKEQAVGQADATKLIDYLFDRMMNTPVRHDRNTPDYLPPTSSSDGRVRTYDRFSKAIEVEDWSDMLWEAESSIVIASPKMDKITGQPFLDRPNPSGKAPREGTTLRDLLTKKIVEDGVNVTLIMPHPDSVSLRDLKRPLDDEESALDDYRESLAKSKRRWFTFRKGIETVRQERKLEEQTDIGRFTLVLTRNVFFPHRLTMTEKRMLLTLRFYKEFLNSRFCIDAGPHPTVDQYETAVYELIRQDIAEILKEDGTVSDDEFEEWRNAN